jgi:Methyltransferase domain
MKIGDVLTDIRMMKTQHLDLGCGGRPRNPYQKTDLYGLDIKVPDDNIDSKFVSANLSLERIPFPDSYFDSISSFDFLEHIPRVLSVAGGSGTRLPFIELMNEVHRTADYFCGDKPLAEMYGFKGNFQALRNEWAMLPEDFWPGTRLSLLRKIKRWQRMRSHRLSHIVWEFVCMKSE